MYVDAIKVLKKICIKIIKLNLTSVVGFILIFSIYFFLNDYSKFQKHTSASATKNQILNKTIYLIIKSN